MQVLNGNLVATTASDKKCHSLGGDGGGGDVDVWGYIEDKMSIHVIFTKKEREVVQINWFMKYNVKQISTV
jgi:hypothetical protein